MKDNKCERFYIISCVLSEEILCWLEIKEEEVEMGWWLFNWLKIEILRCYISVLLLFDVDMKWHCRNCVIAVEEKNDVY